jgi:hypothetical protein
VGYSDTTNKCDREDSTIAKVIVMIQFHLAKSILAHI